MGQYNVSLKTCSPISEHSPQEFPGKSDWSDTADLYEHSSLRQKTQGTGIHSSSLHVFTLFRPKL
ncbi:hypothetical protein HanRHA438_Chr06g0278861 [Helianthus annuus]|nr:hypothetical protein HanRHA438_Chr06g0278861 [Helianthus annuus]